MARVLVGATNYGVWAEELQAPWDALRRAGHDVVLATQQGKKPLPLNISVDADFIDPVQGYKVNPKDVCDRVRELVAGEEWSHPIRFRDARMADFDAIVLTGGLGAMLDIANNPDVHRLLIEASRTAKVIGAICYSVAALLFTRDPDNNYCSIVHGRTITAHPRAWDFMLDCSYELYAATDDNRGTDLMTPGFLFPLQDLAIDAVGPGGRVSSDPRTTRENPDVQEDGLLITACSVESSIRYGDQLVQKLARVAAAGA